jgi:hypothetical protein
MSNYLIISDLQTPFQHKDAIAFLAAVRDKYNTTKTICIGDESDNYWASSYAKSPEAPNAELELSRAIKAMQGFYSEFPKVQVISSNHLDRIQKIAQNQNIPKQVLKSTQEIFKAPKGWNWSRSLKIKIKDQYCFFTHGRTKDLSWAKSTGMNLVQGHHHELFQIIYYRPNTEEIDTSGLRWSMFVGCLIDNSTIPFDYNKNNKQMPINGCGVIFEGYPILVPMFLNSKGRWTGKL